ncbi:MAG TPA: radical SAM protein [Candidatus Rifleibacterium sp.]|nr:radical SAM protein [Candidatus Rifleibacterium sp.]
MFGFQWHLTDLCNRRCRHCYQSAHEEADPMAGAAKRRLAADAILAAIPNEPVTINLTGGEPLMLPDLTDLIAYLENYENLAEINIITNGTVEDRKLLTKLGSFARLRSFRISLESGDEKINDFIRGNGSLAGLRRTIPLYREITGKSVTLMMTLSRLNCETIKETVDFARETGADDILFERFIPLGTGLDISESLLSADDWYKAIRSIGAAAGLEIDPDELAACRAFGLITNGEAEPEDILEAALCNLGPESMALMPDGTVFPCRRLQIPVGNILHEPFSAIRLRLAEWECSRIRPKLHGIACGSCPYDDCPGCRALARALSGDPLGDDPQCVLNRKDS